LDILDRITALLEGRDQKELTDYLGLKNVAFSEWKSGKSKSYRKYLIEIANFFGVSLDYLVYGKVEQNQLPTEEAKMLSIFNHLKPADKIRVIERAEPLAELAAERAAKERAAEQSKKKIAAPAADELPNDEPEDDEQEQEVIKIMHSFYKVSAGHGFDMSGDEEWEEIEIPDTNEARKADYALTIQGDSMEPIYYDGDIVLIKKQDAIDIGQIGIFILDGSGFIKKYNGDRLISLNEKYDDILLEDYSDCRCDGRVIGRV